MPVPLTLPVTLQRNDAGMRRPAGLGLVDERHFHDAPAFGGDLHQDRLQGVEVRRQGSERMQDRRAVEAHAARHVAHAERQAAAEQRIQRAAEPGASRRHPGRTARHVARADEHLAVVTPLPEVAHDRAGRDDVGIDGEHPGARRRREAGGERGAVAGHGGRDDAGVTAGGGFSGSVWRRQRHEDLARAPERREGRFQTGQGPRQLGAFPVGRQHDREIDHSRLAARRYSSKRRGALPVMPCIAGDHPRARARGQRTTWSSANASA